jgi:hypothetical protein
MHAFLAATSAAHYQASQSITGGLVGAAVVTVLVVFALSALRALFRR